MDLRRTHDHLDVRTRLAEQSRGLERALAPADHDDVPAGEAPQIRVLARMARQLARQPVELPRLPREVRDTGGDDDARARDRLAVLEP